MEFQSLRDDNGMKNVLFFSQKPKIFKKRAWEGYSTHMAHLKFLLAGSAVKIENFLGFSPAS